MLFAKFYSMQPCQCIHIHGTATRFWHLLSILLLFSSEQRVTGVLIFLFIGLSVFMTKLLSVSCLAYTPAYVHTIVPYLTIHSAGPNYFFVYDALVHGLWFQKSWLQLKNTVHMHPKNGHRFFWFSQETCEVRLYFTYWNPRSIHGERDLLRLRNPLSLVNCLA